MTPHYLAIKGMMVRCGLTQLAFCTTGNHWAVTINGHVCPQCESSEGIFGFNFSRN